MSETKTKKSSKKQLGQFLTPFPLAEEIINLININPTDRVLEPGCGTGAFLIPIIKKFLVHNISLQDILTKHVWGVEIDPNAHTKCLQNLEQEFGKLPEKHNIILNDFLLTDLPKFNHIIGNPPFGGTINPQYQDALDKTYGYRNNIKIKKETYSFFIIKCFDNHLEDNGNITFICSDTFLTIPTMKGLRNYLSNNQVSISKLKEFSEETSYPMVILNVIKSPSTYLIYNNTHLSYENIQKTPNLSWTIQEQHSDLFQQKLSDYIVCSSGMTTGKNEYFLKEIQNDTIIENYEFTYFEDPITLEKELQKAKLNYLSPQKQEQIKQQEAQGKTKRNIKITKIEPTKIQLPHPDYCYYNKSNNDIIYTKPTHVIYWKDNGDAVKTFKKNGSWYLHGVGGMPYFGKEGLTWSLISSKLKIKYLPPGYILDSGSPCAFLKQNINKDELYFVFGWLLSDFCNYILKTYINHTKNIQSKDVEKLPYPIWATQNKEKVVQIVKKIIEDKKLNLIDTDLLYQINIIFQKDD